MIIKSHIRGGYRAAAQYLKEYNKNEKIRLVEISDPDAQNLNEAFHNMWTLASTTKATKPLHHISINPHKDERLTDKQVKQIVERCEQKYGYQPNCHQRVIVEHVLNGRQHFHVMWNRVSMDTGKPIWPGHHWKKSKQAARELEKELGLKRPVPRRFKRAFAAVARGGRSSKHFGRYQTLQQSGLLRPVSLPWPSYYEPSKQTRPFFPIRGKRKQQYEYMQIPQRPLKPRRPEDEAMELLIWAWENKRADILYQFGIVLPQGYFEP